MKKLEKLNAELEDEIYELTQKRDEHVDIINDLESQLSSEQKKSKHLQKQLEEKEKLLEENHKSLCYYIEKYIKGDEERGISSAVKSESGSEAIKPQLIDITEVDMEFIQK